MARSVSFSQKVDYIPYVFSNSLLNSKTTLDIKCSKISLKTQERRKKFTGKRGSTATFFANFNEMKEGNDTNNDHEKIIL